KLLRISLTPLISEPCEPLCLRMTVSRNRWSCVAYKGLNPRPACCFQGLFSGGGDVSLRHKTRNPVQNAFAPVLGGGRFTQPGADGGERLKQSYERHRNGAADNSGAAALLTLRPLLAFLSSALRYFRLWRFGLHACCLCFFRISGS